MKDTIKLLIFKAYIYKCQSQDSYLTSGKSHSSEIRLARFLINHLKNGQVFYDVGAHYGFFSLLADKVLNGSGKVYSFEASSKTFSVLQKNMLLGTNMEIYNVAISDSNGHIIFYAFPNLYSEYNSFNIDQYKQKGWFKHNKPRAVKINSICLDDFITKQDLKPAMLKIDVEGGELDLIKGLKNYLREEKPTLIIEFLSEQRGNEAHQMTADLLRDYKYKAYSIADDGGLVLFSNINKHLKRIDLKSDNIVFKKMIIRIFAL